jgi:hypothetical protein
MSSLSRLIVLCLYPSARNTVTKEKFMPSVT